MWILCLSFAIVVLDQVTKHWAQSRILLGDGIDVIPGFFRLSYVQNTGAAWGILQGRNHWLIVVSVVMLGLLIAFRRHFIGDHVVSRLSVALIVGGILGNLVDRLRVGYVIDFLDFNLAGYPFPAFNVADAAICTGVACYIILQWRMGAEPSAAAGAVLETDETH